MTATRHVPVGDTSLPVELLGDGEPVVVIRTALDAEELSPLARELARELQVVHQHRRGYGGSGHAVRRSLADDAADTAAVMRALGLGPVHVLGSSHSAAVALLLAAGEPDLVGTVVAVEPPPAGTPGAAAFRDACRRYHRLHRDRGSEVALEQFMVMLSGPGWRAEAEARSPGSVAAMERDAGTFFRVDLPALAGWRLTDEDARGIRAPLLCVGGSESSAWFGEMRARLCRLVPDCTDEVVAGAGHDVAAERPAEVAALVVRHVRRHR